MRSCAGRCHGVLYVLRVASVDGRVRAWRPRLDGVTEVFHARFVDHAYPPHVHDTWAVLIVDDGAIRYQLDGRECRAGGATVTVLPPGVVHDGRPAGRAGFRKRVLYLDDRCLPAALCGRAVDRSTWRDPLLWWQLDGLHRALAAGEDALDGEERLAVVGEALRARLSGAPVPGVGAPGRGAGDTGTAARLRELLDASWERPLTLADASRELQRHPTHLARAFRTAYGVSPHAYVIGLRVAAARRLLLDGWPVSAVAAACGFSDQAHLTRHFRRHVATTPGRFGALAAGGV